MNYIEAVRFTAEPAHDAYQIDTFAGLFLLGDLSRGAWQQPSPRVAASEPG
jgi:hypothetical protein